MIIHHKKQNESKPKYKYLSLDLEEYESFLCLHERKSSMHAQQKKNQIIFSHNVTWGLDDK